MRLMGGVIALFVASLIVVAVVVLGGTLVKQRVVQMKGRIQTAARDTNIGYPAPITAVVHDGVYAVNFALEDKWPNTTNWYAVLQSVIVHNPSRYEHSRTQRLFKLPFLLETGYARFYWTGTNLSFDAYPPPQQP